MNAVKKVFSRLFNREIIVSEQAHIFKDLFNSADVENNFFDSMLSHFVNFEQIDPSKNKSLFDDVQFIIECTITDMTSKTDLVRSSKRIDSYLYIYRQIEEYEYKSHSAFKLLQQFRDKLYYFMETTFSESKGEQPNICVQDSKHLLKMKIHDHLNSITRIDDSNLLFRFFVLCKLSMQAARILTETRDKVQWIEILRQVKQIKYNLREFIGCYLTNVNGFAEFPIDLSAFLYLIQKLHPPKDIEESPFRIFLLLSRDLKLDVEIFLDLLQDTFINGVKRDDYQNKHIVDILKRLHLLDALFFKYLFNYVSNTNTDNVWDVFLSLSKTIKFNDKAKDSLKTVLADKITQVPIMKFIDYGKQAIISKPDIPDESQAYFSEIYQFILDKFISERIVDPNHSFRFTSSHYRDILEIDSKLLTEDRLKRPAWIILIHKILFDTDVNIKVTCRKIQILFENLQSLNESVREQYLPEQIISDENLKYFVINNLEIWLKFNVATYGSLCKIHYNNSWIIYVWKRIMHLTLSKFANDNTNKILIELDKWMNDVEHKTYDRNDILTVIFVKKLFEFVISQYTNTILALPNIKTIMKYVLAIYENREDEENNDKYESLIQSALELLKDIFQLKSRHTLNRDLLTRFTIIDCFLPFIDLTTVFNSTNTGIYEFPNVNPTIKRIISLPILTNIDLNVTIVTKEQFFRNFIEQINLWHDWFDRFIDKFQSIIEWLKSQNAVRSSLLYADLVNVRHDNRTNLLDIKSIVERMLKILNSLKDLESLCNLFNCLKDFRILDASKLNMNNDASKFRDELKRFSNNTFTIDGRSRYEHVASIIDHQHVQWSLASERHAFDIQVIYQAYGNNRQPNILFEKKNVSIDKYVLHGQFETFYGGQLFIIIISSHYSIREKIFFRIKSKNLLKSQLFQGIFQMQYDSYYENRIESTKDDECNDLIDKSFEFVGKLLDGSLSLSQMSQLMTTFYDKNINIHDEVTKLYTHRFQIEIIDQTNQDKINEICEWLQIYQYYSHVNIIIECVEKFSILPDNNQDKTIGQLKLLSDNEDRSLREITEAYKILRQHFQNLSHQHLQLIKTMVECYPVVSMMKKADLYSDNGRRRFQDLRGNLTNQFHLQEKNSMILTSWIITHTLVEPFTYQSINFEDFVSKLARLENIEENSLNHIKIVNDNLQIVTMWLSSEDTTVLDNALITMEHIYKNGRVDIYLRHLLDKMSYYEIEYSIDRIENIKFTLSMSDIDDHKRQLTFCNVDVEQNLIYKKSLINGQLKLLKIIEQIYEILKKLELAGHPDFQLRDEHLEINLQLAQTSSFLSDLRNNQNILLENGIEIRINSLKLIYNARKTSYDMWIKALDKYRRECPLLKLYSNRAIMICLILLRSSSTNSIKNRFLKKIFPLKNLNNDIAEEENLTIVCLGHYLRTIGNNETDLSYDRIKELYQTYHIESSSNLDLCLQNLCKFLQDIFQSHETFVSPQKSPTESQQYLVSINPDKSKQNTNSLEHGFDLNTCCILLNIFKDHLPSAHQILWCKNATDEDILLFFSRIRSFPWLTFVIMDIDEMHHRLRELLLNQQDLLTWQTNQHGPVYYFSNQLTTGRKGLRIFHVPDNYKYPSFTNQHLMNLCAKDHVSLSNIKIIYGEAGIGKTHHINTQCKTDKTFCFSINDKLKLSLLTNSFLSFDSSTIDNDPSVFFNISIHAPFESLNRTLFSLFICGCLIDSNSGLVFSLSKTKQWTFIIEIPYSNLSNKTLEENYKEILPLLHIISPSTISKITDEDYQLDVGVVEEELIARFLKAYTDRTIDRMATINQQRKEVPVQFAKLTNRDECREHIYNCIRNYAPELPLNKIYQLSFTKFLYRRLKFFEGPHYCWNQVKKQLGTTAMKQMIEEAKSLTNINFKDENYPRFFLVYDPGFALHLLHCDWNHVPNEIKNLFDNKDPIKSDDYKNKDYYVECLSWLIDISYETFMKVVNELKFVLTENFAYKLLHIHERKLTKLPLIIEGDTGVGKTFLLKFYSSLLNLRTRNDPLYQNEIPRIVENSHKFLRNLIKNSVVKEQNILNPFLLRIKSKLLKLKEDNDDENFNGQLQLTSNEIQDDNQIDDDILKYILESLDNYRYNKKSLYEIWRTIITIVDENGLPSISTFIQTLHDYVTMELTNYPLLSPSLRLQNLLEETASPNKDISIGIFFEYLFRSHNKSYFYRLLLHPGITEEQLIEFMSPICQLARELPPVEIIVFFDEVNTSSCLGLFKEMFMDGTLHGVNIPKNIFFTAAINPSSVTDEHTGQVHRANYIVHELPESLKYLKVSYGPLQSKTLADYICRKIAMFKLTLSSNKDGKTLPMDEYFQNTLATAIIAAQTFCEEYLGHNSVSQREIQRCFNLIEFFWNMRYDDEIDTRQNTYNPSTKRCIILSIALIYYFRLPTKDDFRQHDDRSPSRENFELKLRNILPEFARTLQNELKDFVNKKNFVIPPGVAINQAIREHMFSIVVCIVTRTPLCIIGIPGQSKTLSFQIVLQNLQGAQLSIRPFCKRLPSIDPFFCLGSKYSHSEDIAAVFDRALKREQQYENNRINTRCVVFLDEASLPDEKKMVLKVLHPYLDDCKVAFVAIANKAFDAANANRMICVYRSLPSEDDQKVLADGCLGLQFDENEQAIDSKLNNIIYGLCQSYRKILRSSDIQYKIFHDRDFIYMLRQLRFELKSKNDTDEMRIGKIEPKHLLRALEDNFNGVRLEEFDTIVKIFAETVGQDCPEFRSLNTEKAEIQRNILTILRESLQLDANRRRLYGRYKLIIDESEDESAVRLLFQTGILDQDPNKTTVFRLSDFPEDIDNELRNVAILSTIKLCMETGKTILMINTGRIHDSLYDVFNQNFSIMVTDGSRKIFSKVAIGPKTIDVTVHEDFQCIVHIKRSEFKDIPAPFLSRFQKYSLSLIDFYKIHLDELPSEDRKLLQLIEDKVKTFIEHFGKEYFPSYSENTLYSCLLSLIKRDKNRECYLSTIGENYTQLNIKSKVFIEKNPTDKRQCLLHYILSKFLQLASPESMIYKLPTFDEEFAQILCQNYFYQQEHFSIENFLRRLILKPSTEIDNNQWTIMSDEPIDKTETTRKVMVYTRTSSFVIGLIHQSTNELFRRTDENDINISLNDMIDLIKLSTIENSIELDVLFENFIQNNNKSIMMIVIDGRLYEQRLHIPYIRQLIDRFDQTRSLLSTASPKYFVMLIHSSGEELNHQSCFPSIFLHGWDYWFLDTCTTGSAIHLQKMLQIFTSKVGPSYRRQLEPLDNSLYDLNLLYDDCLWDFCTRLKVYSNEISSDAFTNQKVFEFYDCRTSIKGRFQCLKEILEKMSRLKTHLVSLYHENVSMKDQSLRKYCHFIYRISKDTLCGKNQNGLVDTLQSKIRTSFTNFICNVLKIIIDDYGLETLVKFSKDDKLFLQCLELTDYSSFIVNEDDEYIPIIQGNLTINSNYSFIPETPFYFRMRKRIQLLFNELKENLVQNPIEPIGEVDDEYDRTNLLFQQLRQQLTRAIAKDKRLTNIISKTILKSYTIDSLKALYCLIEKSSQDDKGLFEKRIEIIARWLLLTSDNEQPVLNSVDNSELWFLSHVYVFIECDHVDLLSFYSACRIMENLDLTRNFYVSLFEQETITRAKVRDNLFELMFSSLWTNLNSLIETDESVPKWIHSYTLISKYYPSERVLQRFKLIDIQYQIEFMNLAYLILLNDKTPKPIELIQLLLNRNATGHANARERTCLKSISILIENVYQYFHEKTADSTTLMIDIQQWIIKILKSMNRTLFNKEITNLLKFLNQSTRYLSLPVKQYLFDELMNTNICKNQIENQMKDSWDRICLLPIIIECTSIENLENCRLRYHPSIIVNENENENNILIDLYFFYLRRLSKDDDIRYELMQKLMLAQAPKINDRNLIPTLEHVFKQFKDYFLLEKLALFLCRQDLLNENIDSILKTIIQQYLTIDEHSSNCNDYVKLFLGTIINKHSWTYVFDLFQSERFQRVNSQWSNTIHRLLPIKANYRQYHNRTLHLCNQLQFTMTQNNSISILSKLNQPYFELQSLIYESIEVNDLNQRWTSLSKRIQTQLNINSAVEIKVILILIIYYNFYCNNQLNLLDGLLTIIQNQLDPLPEEHRVFQALLKPHDHIIGYPQVNNAVDQNCINDSFRIDCDDNDDLYIRHLLVNLLAMIILSGKNSFLWTFTFEPLKLTNTLGFGSLRDSPITASGVHYDCGCTLNQDGRFTQGRGHGSVLDIPAVYVAYFATFGALTWHLLLYNESVTNMNGPIISTGSINNTDRTDRLAGDSIRAKTCNFIRTRLVSAKHFLSMQYNSDDACIIFNRCFEHFAYLCSRPTENPWIKPIYRTAKEKRDAEQEFQVKVFNRTYQELNDNKTFVNNLQLQTQLAVNIEKYRSEMPILIDFQHFRTQLSDQQNITKPLMILKRLLDDFDFLTMTKYIYDLSQFYLLLHRTYNQLIEFDEFEGMTLNGLYERAHRSTNRMRERDVSLKEKSIIEKGITAVNKYHHFTAGLIRPGPCDRTEHFCAISENTPIHYLVDTGKSEDGNIIMRILSVLVDYHNRLLKLLGEEMMANNDHLGIGALNEVAKELIEREISILRISQDTMGIIQINPIDQKRIEQLSRASLIKFNSTIDFDFLYVQTHLIRSYLLYYCIDYEHIQSKYQCHVNKLSPCMTENSNEWIRLQQMNFDQFKREYDFLQCIMEIITNSSDNFSTMNLSEFVRHPDYQDRFLEQYEQYGINDFSLFHIRDICHLYSKALSNCHSLFNNAKKSLSLPLKLNLNEQLHDKLMSTLVSTIDPNDKDEVKQNIQLVNEFLNDLKNDENLFAIDPLRSLQGTCRILDLNEKMIECLLPEINCENYVPVCIKLIEIRTKLQELLIDIEEKIVHRWYPAFNDQKTDVANRNSFDLFRQADHDIPLYNNEQETIIQIDTYPISQTVVATGDSTSIILDLLDEFDFDRPVSSTVSTGARLCDNESRIELKREEIAHIDFSSLATLTVKYAPLERPTLFDQCRMQAKTILETPISKFFRMKLFDNKEEKYFCLRARLYQQFEKIFQEKKYDSKVFGILDQYNLLIDFPTVGTNIEPPIMFEKYQIAKRTSFIPIILIYDNFKYEYHTVKETFISAIINQFIISNQSKFLDDQTVFYIFDQIGQYLSVDIQVENIYRPDFSSPIHIELIRSDQDASVVCELSLIRNLDTLPIMQRFNQSTPWKHVSEWIHCKTEIPNVNFWNDKQQILMNDNQSITTTLNSNTEFSIQVLSNNDFVDIIYSYDKISEKLRVLKSCPISVLLNNLEYLQTFNLIASPKECTLSLLGELNKNLIDDDLKKSFGEYAIGSNDLLHFRISIHIEIIPYDNSNETQSIFISNRNITFKQLFDQVLNDENYIYLALFKEKSIVSPNEYLSTTNETKFYLCKEHHTCLISIEIELLVDMDDIGSSMKDQRYLCDAIVDNIYKRNSKTIRTNQYIVYQGDIIPSPDICLHSFLSETESSIHFGILDYKLPFDVTVNNEDKKKLVQFQCSEHMSIGRIRHIVCQLSKLDEEFYHMRSADNLKIDDVYKLHDVMQVNDPNDTISIELKLISSTDCKCVITYENNTITVPTTDHATVEYILQQASKQYQIKSDEIEMFKIMFLDDPENPSNVNSATSIEDLRSVLKDSNTIPFKLEKIIMK